MIGTFTKEVELKSAADAYLFIRYQYLVSCAPRSVYLDLFGDELSRREKFGDVDDREAIALYLQKRDGISAAKVLTYSDEHLRLLLSSEMQGWKAPVKIEIEAQNLESNWARRLAQKQIQAGLDYLAECFGDHLSETHGYGSVDGRDALVVRVIEKFGLHPGEAQALSTQSLSLMLMKEMEAWTPGDKVTGSIGEPEPAKSLSEQSLKEVMSLDQGKKEGPKKRSRARRAS